MCRGFRENVLPLKFQTFHLPRRRAHGPKPHPCGISRPRGLRRTLLFPDLPTASLREPQTRHRWLRRVRLEQPSPPGVQTYWGVPRYTYIVDVYTMQTVSICPHNLRTPPQIGNGLCPTGFRDIDLQGRKPPPFITPRDRFLATCHPKTQVLLRSLSAVIHARSLRGATAHYPGQAPGGQHPLTQ